MRRRLVTIVRHMQMRQRLLRNNLHVIQVVKQRYLLVQKVAHRRTVRDRSLPKHFAVGVVGDHVVTETGAAAFGEHGEELGGGLVGCGGHKDAFEVKAEGKVGDEPFLQEDD